MVTNRRRPILKIMEDTAPGTHDTLLAACDRYCYRYELLGCKEYHRNCADTTGPRWSNWASNPSNCRRLKRFSASVAAKPGAIHNALVTPALAWVAADTTTFICA